MTQTFIMHVMHRIQDKNAGTIFFCVVHFIVISSNLMWLVQLHLITLVTSSQNNKIVLN